MSDQGTIRGREARDVIEDVIKARNIPKGLWSFRNKSFHFLVGSRQIAVPAPAGLTFYALKATAERVEQIAAEIDNPRRNRNQLDIEDSIKAAAP